MTCGAASDQTSSIQINVQPNYWLGFTEDWSDGSNWCGRVPTINDSAVVNIAYVSPTFSRPAASYHNPVAAKGDSVVAKTLILKAGADSMTVVTDSSLTFKVAGDLTNNGKFAIYSAQAADTATIGSGALVSTGNGELFRCNQTDQVYQVIYNVSELTGIGMLAGQLVDSLLFQMRIRNSTSTYTAFTISYLQVPPASLPGGAFSSTSPITGAFTTVYGPVNLSTLTPANGQFTPYSPLPSRTFLNAVTSNGSTTVSSVTPLSAPAVLPGDLITGPGILPGTFVQSVSGVNHDDEPGCFNRSWNRNSCYFKFWWLA